MNEKRKSTEMEGNRFELEKIDDQQFESFISELCKCSDELKEKFDYTDALLIEGGSDRGKDCVLYKNGDVVGIVQCKHSIKTTSMNRNIIIVETLKMLLYLFIEPNLLSSITKKYIFFISSKITQESFEHLKKFKENELKDKDKLSKNIKMLRKKYKSISEKIKEEDIKEELFIKLESIFDSLERYYLMDNDIQTFLASENSMIGLIKIRYFNVKKVLIKDDLEFPRIKNKEEDLNKYLKERFYQKLEEIQVTERILEDALKSYNDKMLYTVELFKINSLYLEEDLEEYENTVKDKEINLREEQKINLEIENFDQDRLIKEYSKYYLKMLREIEICKFRNFDYIPSGFAKGTIQQLINIEEIESWILLKDKEKNDGDYNS